MVLGNEIYSKDYQSGNGELVIHSNYFLQDRAHEKQLDSRTFKKLMDNKKKCMHIEYVYSFAYR